MKADMAILVCDQETSRKKEGHFIMIKGLNPLEHKTTLNVYVPSIRSKEQILNHSWRF